jgi:5-hydroxyisourate hydrolase
VIEITLEENQYGGWSLGRLTTHVLDTARGAPAGGLAIELFRVGDTKVSLAQVTTNEDGRVDGALLDAGGFTVGAYELVFQVGAYLDGLEGGPKENRFLDEVVIRFSIDAADEHYHVPLLLSPFGYSTYRGS